MLAAKECQRQGLTTVFDMACVAGEAYKELAAAPQSDFPVRVRMYPTNRTGSGKLPEQPHDFGDERLRMGGVKCWSDGSLQGYTGFLSAPYHRVEEAGYDACYCGYACACFLST